MFSNIHSDEEQRFMYRIDQSHLAVDKVLVNSLNYFHTGQDVIAHYSGESQLSAKKDFQRIKLLN